MASALPQIKFTPAATWFTPNAAGLVSTQGQFQDAPVALPGSEIAPSSVYWEHVVATKNWAVPTYGDYGALSTVTVKNGGLNSDVIGAFSLAIYNGGTGDFTAHHGRAQIFPSASAGGLAGVGYAYWGFMHLVAGSPPDGSVDMRGGTCVEFNIYNEAGVSSQHWALGTRNAMTIQNSISEQPLTDQSLTYISSAHQYGRNATYNTPGDPSSGVVRGGSRFWTIHYTKTDWAGLRDRLNNLCEYEYVNGSNSGLDSPNYLALSGNWYQGFNLANAVINGGLFNFSGADGVLKTDGSNLPAVPNDSGVGGHGQLFYRPTVLTNVSCDYWLYSTAQGSIPVAIPVFAWSKIFPPDP